MSGNIMYVCKLCHENAPEACGHFDRKELAVMPDGTWLCSDCIDYASDDEMRDYGVSISEDEGRPYFKSFPHPPEYMPGVTDAR